jgi:transcriptional regulator with XRE-family HTH domain
MNAQTTIRDFKNQLGMIRERKGITQVQLSRYSGLDLSDIQAIETGKSDPEFIVLLTIADTLEIEIKDCSDR